MRNTDGLLADSGWVLCATRVQFPNEWIPDLVPPEQIIQLLSILRFVGYFLNQPKGTVYVWKIIANSTIYNSSSASSLCLST